VRSVITRLLRQVTATQKEKETTATTAANTVIRDKTVTGTMAEIRTAAGVINVMATSSVVKDTTTTATATSRLNTVTKTPLKRQLPVKATTAIKTVMITTMDEISTMNKIPLRPSRISTLNKRLPQVATIKAMVMTAARKKIKVRPVRTTMLSSPVCFMASRVGNCS
jgi:hypothetical protein